VSGAAGFASLILLKMQSIFAPDTPCPYGFTLYFFFPVLPNLGRPDRESGMKSKIPPLNPPFTFHAVFVLSHSFIFEPMHKSYFPVDM
jgi:hypothetical protein